MIATPLVSVLAPCDLADALPSFFVARTGPRASLLEYVRCDSILAWRAILSETHAQAWVAVALLRTPAEYAQFVGMLRPTMARENTAVILALSHETLRQLPPRTPIFAGLDDLVVVDREPLAAIISAYVNASAVRNVFAAALRLFSGRWGAWSDRVVHAALGTRFAFDLVKAASGQLGVDRWTLRRHLSVIEGVGGASQLVRGLRAATGALVAWETTWPAVRIARYLRFADERPLNASALAVFDASFGDVRDYGLALAQADREAWLSRCVDEFVHYSAATSGNRNQVPRARFSPRSTSLIQVQRDAWRVK